MSRARRGWLPVVGWAALATVALIASVVSAVSAENRNAGTADDRCGGASCTTVLDLVGPPGQLPSAAQLGAEFPGETIVASWTLGSTDRVFVPAPSGPGEYGTFAACSGGGTLTVVAHSTTDRVGLTFGCDGHLRPGLFWPISVADSGSSPDGGGSYELTVTTTGTVSAAEVFVLGRTP